MSEEASQRIDKWLWFARVVKTCTLAQKLAVSGKVRVNREKNEHASRLVKPGDTLTIALDRSVRILRLLAPGERRGPPAEARCLYDDLSPPEPRSQAADDRLPEHAARPPGSGRPTKRDRRRIEGAGLGRGNPFADSGD